MQTKKYPLPPLFLTEVIDRCRADHTHTHSDYCVEEPDYCKDSMQHQCNMEPVIVEITEGHGRHQCDDDCTLSSYTGKCLRSCEDSDWVVDLRYHTCGWGALYGIKRHGDVQHISLWAD